MDQELHGNAPLVSVVMCAYNGLPYINEAVESIFRQTYKNWELIICDDGSNDGTREWLSENYGQHAQIRLYLNEKNLGYVGNKNYGHTLAKGEWITQLDNDDLYHPDKLQQQVEVIMTHKDIRMIGCGYFRLEQNGETNEPKKVDHDFVIDKRPNEGYPFWFPSLLVHKSVYEKFGYYNEYFAGALGDDVYWTNKANSMFPIYMLKAPLYYYRNNPTSITNVHGNLRKLIMLNVLDVLYRQRTESNTDWLEEKRFDLLTDLEKSLVGNNKLMAEKYRMNAAKAIDYKDYRLAKKLIFTSLKKNYLTVSIYRTILYYLKNSFTKRS